MKSARVNFSLKTKRLVAERAALRCSYPTCGIITTGPGAKNDETSNSGTAAHIYSASDRGPRGQGGLTKEELEHPDNAIWLCHTHGRLIDNNRGVRFPPQLLLSYKHLHEARVAREHQGLYSPICWFHKITIRESPIFECNSSLTLSKLNLLIGDNGTGKSAICQCLKGLFDQSALDHWRPRMSPLDYTLKLFMPQETEIGMEINSKDVILYRINGKESPLNPIQSHIISPKRDPPGLLAEEYRNDIIHLARALGVDSPVVKNLLNEIRNYRHSKIRNIDIVEEGPIQKLRFDLEDVARGMSYGSLSGGEREIVLIEFSSALARYCGRYSPTLLILDGTPILFTEKWFDDFGNHFLDPDNQFQTILTIPSREIDIDNIHWNGWQIIRTEGTPPECKILQE